MLLKPIPDTDCHCGEPWHVSPHGSVTHPGICPFAWEDKSVLEAFEKAEQHGLIEKVA